MKTWKCQRQSNSKICGAVNPSRVRKCQTCGKWKPKKYQAKHKQILDVPYEEWALLYGEECNICGRPPSATRRLDRDHRHSGEGTMRGLLCHRCNRNLKGWMTSGWLLAAANYLERAGE
jgi:hypothetical protein